MKRATKCLLSTTFAFLIMVVSPTISWAQDPTIQITELNLTDNHNYGMKYVNTGVQITPPHWTSTGQSDPVFYLIGEPINVDAKLELSYPYTGAVWVKATGTDGLTISTRYFYLQSEDEIVLETQTNEDAGIMTSNTVGIDTLQFTWYYSYDSSSGPWTSAGTTSNICFLVFDTPRFPWSSTGYDGRPPVFVEMMDYACNGAAGMSTKNAAMAQIVQKLYTWMIYNGRLHYTTSPYNFYVEAFLKDSDYYSGPEEGTDCRDFASVTLSMTAAIGDDSLNISRMNSTGIEDPPGSFVTHPIWPARASGAIHSGTEWNYHQVNYIPTDEEWHIIDASLKLDSTINNGNQWDSPGILADYVNNDLLWDEYTEQLSRDLPLYNVFCSNYCNLIMGTRY